MKLNYLRWFQRLPRWARMMFGLVLIALLLICGFVALMLYSSSQSDSSTHIRRWFRDEDSRDELITVSRERCGDAPFILPSDGFIGLLYADPAGPYSVLNRHTGIDIFGDGEPGEVPVYAAYDGYLTRLEAWVSSVIIEHDDPLNEGQKIWTYYTHMASEDGESYIVDAFPSGTRGMVVEQGTMLGYQGEYNGSANFPIGLHLHFSIVKSDDNGSFLNEANLDNTLDPTPYLGLKLRYDEATNRPIRCEED